MTVRFHWAWRLCSILLALLGAGIRPVAAQAPGPPKANPRQVREQFEEWQQDFVDVVADLKKNTPDSNKHAERLAFSAYREVRDRAIEGEGLCNNAGRFLIMLAIAEVRRGKPDDGAWHWQMAQNVFAELRTSAFNEFPDVAHFMEEKLIPASRWGDLQQYATGQKECTPLKSSEENLVGPKIIKKLQPRYPRGMEGRRIKSATTVAAIIDTQGRVREPVVSRGCGYVAFDLAAMEALKDWVYAPATRNGVPFPVPLYVSVGFK